LTTVYNSAYIRLVNINNGMQHQRQALGTPRVIIRSCNDYLLDKISGIIRESVQDLNLNIKGKIFIKPNVVAADKHCSLHAFTHPMVTEAMVGILREHAPYQISIGESGGYGSPTRMHLKEAGYFHMAKKTGVDLFDIDERAMVRVPLAKGVWHREILLSKYIKNADFKVWMPKLKYHAFASITHALKLNIGILSHKERLLYHDHRIHDKIVDLLEPGFPDLVVSDAIDITYGVESAPHPIRLGALIVADHPLAADAVAAYIMGYRPADIKHLKIASARGYGSIKLDDIDISGDADIEELRAKPKGKPGLFQVLKELDTGIDFYSGIAPGTDMICDGGCECSVKGCLGMVEKRFPGALKQAGKGAVVTGVFNGDVIMKKGPVLLVGDCTEVRGRLEAKKVHHIKGCPVNTKILYKKLPDLFNLPGLEPGIKGRAIVLVNSIEKAMHIMINRLFLKR
jgi:uncharacterized protein (DUF362 family)